MKLKDLFKKEPDKDQQIKMLKHRIDELNLMLSGMSSQLKESEKKVESLLTDNTHMIKEMMQLKRSYKGMCDEVDELNVLLNNANDIEHDLNVRISELNNANDVLQEELKKLIFDKEDRENEYFPQKDKTSD